MQREKKLELAKQRVKLAKIQNKILNLNLLNLRKK